MSFILALVIALGLMPAFGIGTIEVLADTTDPAHVHTLNEGVISGPDEYGEYNITYTCSCGASYTLYYYAENGNAGITGCTCNGITDIIIPETIGESAVVAIRQLAFSDNADVTSVSIPNTVDTIATGAFSACVNLKTVNIPDSVKRINAEAFCDCSSLTEVILPGDIESIGGLAFAHCSSLTEIVLPVGIKSIESGAFEHCSNLTEVTIPSSLKSLSSGVFDSCSSLQSVSLPDSLELIDSRAFVQCSSLQSIIIPESVTFIGNSAFLGCHNLQTVTISGNPEIEEKCFGFVYDNIRSEYWLLEGFTLHCIKDSSADEYAKANGITTQYIDGELEPDSGDENLISNRSIGLYLNGEMVVKRIYEDDIYQDKPVYWTGMPIVPEVTVFKTDLQSDPLIKDTDYTVEITNNIDIGKATVKIEGIGNYKGTVTLTFYISKVPVDPRSDRFEYTLSQSEYEYDGTEKKPSIVRITDKVRNVDLQEGRDYEFAGYKFNIANEETVTTAVLIRPLGNYTGVNNEYFDDNEYSYFPFHIRPRSLSDATLTLEQTSFEYDGSPKTPSYTLTLPSGLKPVAGQDYEVKYENNVSVGTARLVIKGYDDAFTGTITKEFTITEPSGSGSGTGGSTITYVTVEYDCKTKGHIWNRGTTTAPATCTAKGVKTYTCTACGATETEEIPLAAHKPDEAVKENETAATCSGEGSYDEVICCQVCKEEISRKTITTKKALHRFGEWETILDPTPKKTGLKLRTCEICDHSVVAKIAKLPAPARPVMNKPTAGSKSIKITWKKAGNNTGYQIQYSLTSNFKSSKTITVSKASTLKKTIKNLKAKKKYYVRIRSYKTVNNVKFYSAWSKTKTVKTKA